MANIDVNGFRGDRDRPLRPDEIADIANISAKGSPPKEFEEARTHLHYYVPEKPDIKIERAKDGKPAMYEISLPVSGDFHSGARLGNELVRQSPRAFAEQIKRDVDHSSFRPEWQQLSTVPRKAPSLRTEMRRINGEPVDPLYVFGGDDRWEFRDASWPWGLVGKVITSGGWTGSGALVGGRTLITAGHVVPWGQPGWWMRFIPAYYNGVSLHGAGIESYVSDAYGYDVDGDVTGYDWAACRLYNPLGDWLGYFGYNGYSDSWEDDPYWSIIGYPGAVAGGQRPSFQGSVSVFDDDGDSNGGRELETKADLTPGNSGGPMFGWWNGDPRIIGVVSGQETDYSFPFSWEKGNVIAGGSGFTDICAWARSNWG
jgi:V8-like Glu-specific endopeptidase